MMRIDNKTLLEWVTSIGTIPSDFINNGDGTGDVRYKAVSTYAEMKSLKVKKMTIVLVAVDENKGQNDTEYHIWPNGKRKWLASIND